MGENGHAGSTPLHFRYSAGRKRHHALHMYPRHEYEVIGGVVLLL